MIVYEVMRERALPCPSLQCEDRFIIISVCQYHSVNIDPPCPGAPELGNNPLSLQYTCDLPLDTAIRVPLPLVTTIPLFS